MSGFSDPFIDGAAHCRIEAEFDAIEREHGVRILLAVESGSRAWRFPSRDSDYDVRFIYLQPIENYLTVVPKRDVIERPIDATLDVSGWDLRKALQLLVRSNAVLLEWLASPVRYRDGGAAPARLWELARPTADMKALAYHYDHQARRSFDEIVASHDAVRLKTYCYALRSALALMWLRHRGEPPPMDLPSLMAGLMLSDGVSSAVANLLAGKAEARERDTTPHVSVLDGLIGDALAVPVQEVDSMDRSEVSARADALFASIVLGDRSPNDSRSLLSDQ
jgi:uncharacterized protein